MSVVGQFGEHNKSEYFAPVVFCTLHSASAKFQDWHYKKYLHERNYTFIV